MLNKCIVSYLNNNLDMNGMTLSIVKNRYNENSLAEIFTEKHGKTSE